MQLPKDLKQAISNLSSSEKDKLIFRLLKKDLNLANRLLFELVSEDSVEEQRQLIKERLSTQIRRISQHFIEQIYYYSPGYLNMDVRELSGIINEHVNITKDKYGEIELNLYMINEILEPSTQFILSFTYDKASKFCVAVIARAFKILLLIKKLHEDYFIDFKEELLRLGNLIYDNSYLKKTAMRAGLDINWLIVGNIPDNIAEIHKQFREKNIK